MEKYDRFTRQLGELFNWVSVAAVAAMLAVVVVDIVGSKVFRWPIPGSMDIIGLLGLLIAAFAIARTETFKQHVRVDFFLLRLKERNQGIIGIVTSLFCLILFGLVIWRGFDYAIRLQDSMLSSPTLRIPFYPFAFALAIACIPLFLILLMELFASTRKARKK